MVRRSYVVMHAYRRRVRLQIHIGGQHAEALQLLTMEMMGLL